MPPSPSSSTSRWIGARGSTIAKGIWGGMERYLMQPITSLDDDEAPESTIGSGGVTKEHDKMMTRKPANLGHEIHLDSLLLNDVNSTSQQQQRRPSTRRLIFFGEVHSIPAIVEMQRQVFRQLLPQQANRYDHEHEHETSTESTQESRVASDHVGGRRHHIHVVMEHFSFDMQESLLDPYQVGQTPWTEFTRRYHEDYGRGEGHDLEPYRPLLEDIQTAAKNAAADQSCSIHLHAGFLARQYAKQFLESKEETIQTVMDRYLIPMATENTILSSSSHDEIEKQLREELQMEGTELHYRVFESMFTGDRWAQEPLGQFRRIFQAQVLKDAAMAHKVRSILRSHEEREMKRNQALLNGDSAALSLPTTCSVLVIAGNGHVAHYQGVPERVLLDASTVSNMDEPSLYQEWIDRTVVIQSFPYSANHDDDQQQPSGQEILESLEILDDEGNSSYPADVLLLFEDDEINVIDEEEPAEHEH